MGKAQAPLALGCISTGNWPIINLPKLSFVLLLLVNSLKFIIFISLGEKWYPTQIPWLFGKLKETVL